MPQPVLLEAQWFNPLSWTDAPVLAVIVALWFIVMARANATYWIGRGIAGGTERSKWYGLLESRHYRTAQRWLDRWGAPAVTVCFLTVGVQTMVNLAAGITRMPLRKYLPAVAVGCVLWAIVYGTVGFIGLIAIVKLWEISPWLVILAGVLLLAVVWVTILARRREAREAPEA